MQLLEDYYQNQKKLIDLQVGNAPGETWKGLLAALHLQHIDAANSSQTTMGFKIP
ncbi:putative adenylate kinase 7 mitochondrial [Bienertia sinuspersici]